MDERKVQRLTIDVEYNSRYYSDPETWDWGTLTEFTGGENVYLIDAEPPRDLPREDI